MRHLRSAARRAALALLAGLCLGCHAGTPPPASEGDPVSERASDSERDPAAPAPFPDASTTGVPAGVVLETYDGPCTITVPTVISDVDATETCPAITIQAPNVAIERSRLPRVDATAAEVDMSYSVRVTDSEVLAGQWVGGALWGYNITAIRVDVTGGQHSFHCNDHCVVEDSWLHDQHNPDGEASHNNAFISNGGTDMLLRHNTLHCTAVLNSTGGGCTADFSLFGDFQPISHVTVKDNLFKANDSSASYCAFGGHAPGKSYPVATHVVFTDNVFERGVNGRCGVYGPVTSFQPDAEGNAWTGNTWDDGKPLEP